MSLKNPLKNSPFNKTLCFLISDNFASSYLFLTAKNHIFEGVTKNFLSLQFIIQYFCTTNLVDIVRKLLYTVEKK